MATARAAHTVRNTAARSRAKSLPLRTSGGKQNYAYPRGVGANAGVHPSYPIDPQHVLGSLSEAGQARTAGNLAVVRAAVIRRYGSVSAAVKAARAYPGPGPYIRRPPVTPPRRKRA